MSGERMWIGGAGSGRLARVALLAAASLVVIPAAPAAAQGTAGGWLPWLGCWSAEEAPGVGRVCVRPLEEGDAVEVLQLEAGDVVYGEVLWADGVRHETARAGCDGWEEGRFSEDGRRLFHASDVVCEDGVREVTGGIASIVEPGVWLDVRWVEAEGETTAWVQRYRPAAVDPALRPELSDVVSGLGPSIQTARKVASARVVLDDAIEASLIAPPEAVEAWIAETGDGFDLDADALARMDRAGVPERVIDVVVAVSYPDRFALDDRGEVERAAPAARGGRRGYAYPYGSFRFGRGFYGFGYPYSVGFGSLYDPYRFGFIGGGFFGGFHGHRPTTIIVDRRDTEPRSRGRVIKGRGYRGPRQPASGASSSRSAVPVGRSGASGQPAQAGGGSGVRVAPGAGSSGSKASTGRKAKRRGGR